MKKAITILLILLLASVLANVMLWTRAGPIDTEEKVITIYDTIPYRQPVPVDSVILRYVTERLPAARQPSPPTATIETIVDSMSYESPKDSVEVVIPITQKIYEDSTFRAYVSGYRPALDSIEIFKRTETVYIRSPTKDKKWGIGIQLGCGMIPNRVQPYIGIGISYNIITF
ncbi:hypothetical protein E4T81_12090 [Barnesiella sp. WM24]|uniref:DUF6808 domain-containing protein n=1 Tax=Barnesiella sp. WM24 TaxID=2558278 RepID=UPI0010719E94|nr:hypothetical protein [Barnesiella sp. WM24]TFU92323.1 hypothetical protein E4T81_12090 [Barnesiella sp. WM24]